MAKLNNATVYSDWTSKELVNIFADIMMQDKPIFVGRIGGNEYLATMYYWANSAFYDNPTPLDWMEGMTPYDFWNIRLRKDTGYFDFANDKNNFIACLQKLLVAYKNYDYIFYAGAPLALEGVVPDNIPDDYINFAQHIMEGKVCMSYGFVESSYPFLSSFKIWGEKKRILVVSPFERSLIYQNARRDKLLQDYTFPNFELVTYKTKILYNTPDYTKERLKVDTNNWHEELERMQKDIEKMDFDVAWLTCASYAALTSFSLSARVII